ncbi:head-tail connector protein [Clostridium perfringens]|uniref:head-tail connector protein n=1 Tax=Clostridium perfringens TaxID=1502 RepID=UPI0023F72818|nr:head-tail connector protein [Clostridium perfringens]MDU0865956.1 head-tail connector protein [Clostridium perfringens]MDU2504593.1 head-tail connector protein [Clostridium perfringens]MDU6349045.1 head-tail connector protein [Clostridium perfringens]WEV23498.1 head-tail connector protein [Clostridium perfringens D]
MVDLNLIDLEYIKNYLRIEQDFKDDDIELETYMIVAKSYLMKKCGLTEVEFGSSQTLLIPYLMLVAEFYTNKSITVTTNSKINPILDRFLAISTKELL